MVETTFTVFFLEAFLVLDFFFLLGKINVDKWDRSSLALTLEFCVAFLFKILPMIPQFSL